MSKSDNRPLHKTLAFAATLAALGAAVGASTEPAHAQQPTKNYAPLLENRGTGMQPIGPTQNENTVDWKSRIGAEQQKERAGATQGKVRAGAGQLKFEQGGAGGAQLPAVNK